MSIVCIRALLTLTFGCIGNVDAWMDTGHMLTAQVAKLQLPPEDVALIDDILSGWAKDFPKSSELVTASVWADHIKCLASVAPGCRGQSPAGLDEFNAWHFGDIPYNPESIHLSAAASEGFDQNPSAVWFLSHAMQTFAVSKSRFALNLMLRFVIHTVGDVHQPLHEIDGFFKNDHRFGTHLEGDRGGNDIPIKTPWKHITNLHKLWDVAGGVYLDEWPLDSSQHRLLGLNATKLVKQFSADTLTHYNSSDVEACSIDEDGHFDMSACDGMFQNWVRETYQLGVDYAYELPGIEANGQPSKAYLGNVTEVCQQQIAIGGYRLADLLKVIVAEIRTNLQIPEPTSPLYDVVNTTIRWLGQVAAVLGGFGLIYLGIGLLRRRNLAHQSRLKEGLLV